ncbi:glycosyltransferase family 4 protein [uncultured Sphaerotilus sp.]|uniref:glycosyltransferase family 4 protein n=1 Tax=uncultured Sphaerotilus sp. TaxID=474984 RepID=UPI0030CA5B25
MNVYIFYGRVRQYGGIERNILALAQVVAASGITPVLICFEDQVDLHRESGGVLQVKVIGSGNMLKRVLRIREIVAANANDSTSLIICFGVWGGAFLSMTGLGYLLHYTDPPSVMPEMVSWFQKVKFSLLSNAAIRRAKSCITMTERNARELRHRFGRDFDVIYQGGVPPPVGFEINCDNRVLRLVSVCRLHASKNLDWAIELHQACMQDERLKDKFTRIELLLIGDGPERDKLQEMAVKSNSVDSVKLLGFCTSEEIERIMATANIAVVPGVQGYGLPVLEALYRGMYVLLNEASGISEILGEDARVCISRNSKADFIKSGIDFLSALDMKLLPDVYVSSRGELPTEDSWGQALGRAARWW